MIKAEREAMQRVGNFVTVGRKLRKVSERIGVSFAPGKIFAECALAVVAKFFQAFVQYDAIFECSVHPLTIEWDDCVRGVAEQANLVTIIPRRTANGY